MEVNKLLHPDLLPDSELFRILESLCIQVSPDLSRSQVLEIFKKVAVPLPRRNKDLKCNKDDSSSTFELNRLSISNKRDHDQGSMNSKKVKYHQLPSDETKDIKDIKCQLNNVNLNDISMKIASDLEPITNKPSTKPAGRKVVLKRSHLFDRGDSTDKRIKLYR